MKRRLLAIAAVALVAAGCADQATAKQQQPGKITVDGTTHTIDHVSCRQLQWMLLVDATAGAARAAAHLRLGAEPTVETINITDFDGFSGVAIDHIDLTADDGTYTITGSLDGSEPAHPDKRRTAPFRIEVPC